METRKNSALSVAAVVVVTLIIFGVLLSAYIYNDWFHSIFINKPADQQVIGEVPQAASKESIAAYKEMIGLMVFGIFSVMISLQVVIFGTAIIVAKNIIKSVGEAKLKLKKLENAEIFFDLPLYAGLFGTVASFMVIAFSRESSLLIAYSTTLMGIIFSVLLRVSVLYPAKRSLLNEVK